MKGRKSENEKKIELFTEWLATPEEERLIKTQKEFAASVGVDEHTLGRWKAQLAETDNVDEITKFRRHVYKQAMRSSATAKHMELYARLKGLWDKSERSETHKMTADELTRFCLDGEAAAMEQLREWEFEGLGRQWPHGGRLYSKGDIEEVLQWAKKEGIISDFKEVPSVFVGYHLPSKCLKVIPLSTTREEARQKVYGYAP